MCGQELYSTKRTSATVRRYFEHLAKTGYAKTNSVKHLLVLLFIADLLKYAGWLVTDEDYAKFGAVLHGLEAGDCLIPYTVFCTNRTAFGTRGDEGDDYAGPIR